MKSQNKAFQIIVIVATTVLFGPALIAALVSALADSANAVGPTTFLFAFVIAAAFVAWSIAGRRGRC